MGNIGCCGRDSLDDQKISKKDMVGVKTQPITDTYQIEKLLGFGSYGEVRVGIHKRSNAVVAIKKIPLKGASEKAVQMVLNEIQTLITVVKQPP